MAEGAALDAVAGVEAVLGEGGALGRVLPGFAPRAPQLAMARAVQGALDAGTHLICEAGTGTGKTLAYLAPVVSGGLRAIVSTGTRHLQEQIAGNDLPLLERALGLRADAVMLKGRTNYLCRHRLELHDPMGMGSGDPADDAALGTIRGWARRTLTGDLAEVAEVPEDAPVWRRLTAGADVCLGADCPRYGECFVLRARRAAAEAHVVIVNHHLLLADLELKEEGFGELLPDAGLVVLDEAHLLPGIATRVFGRSAGTRQVRDLARDLARAATEAPDSPELGDRTRALRASAEAAADLARSGGGTGRRAWAQVGAHAAARAALHDLREALARVRECVASQAERGPGLASCARRATHLLDVLEPFVAGAPGNDDPDGGAEPGERALWMETGPGHAAWHDSPVDVGPALRAHVDRQGGCWVLTSATLAVDDEVGGFAERVGLSDATAQVFGSPFDHRRQALCLLPDGLPEPRHPEHLESLLEVVTPVLEASGGRAFLLFTSHAALRRAATWMREATDYTLLVQGDAPRRELLRRFREVRRPVLLGTQSFWQGVDVRGPALSCVVIDKLPFAPPDDPLLAARAAHLRARDRDPFSELHLPEAVLVLKQGVGRLLRDPEDRGVVVLGDPRLCTRGYGRVFLRSLPPMRITSDVEEACRFLDAGPGEEAGP